MKTLLFAVNGSEAGKRRAVLAQPERRAVGVHADAHVQRNLERVDVEARIRIGHVRRRRHVLQNEEGRGELQVALVARAGALVEDAPAAADHGTRRERRLPGQADPRRDVVVVAAHRGRVLRLVDLAQIDHRAWADVETELQRIESRLEERRIARHLESDGRAQLGRRIGEVVVADAAVALGEGAEHVVAKPRIQRQPGADLPVVLDEAADVAGEVVAPRVALIQVGAAAGGAVAGEEEGPVVVVEVAVRPRHVLAFEADVPVLDAGLQRVAAGDDRPPVGRAPHALDVPEVPRVADAAGVALRVDVDRRHQRGESADRVLERVVDAQRRVEDVAVLRDPRVLQVVVADVRLVQHARAEGVGVRHAAEPGRRLSERGRRRRVGPAERLVDVLDRPADGDARLVGQADLMLHRHESGPCPPARSESPAAAGTRGRRCRCRRSTG